MLAGLKNLMGVDDRRRSFGDLLRLFLFLVCLGSQAVSGEWLSFRGCWNLTSSGDMAIDLTNNGPSACLNACPENTTALALQGHVCECRPTLKGGLHAFIPECKVCSGGDNGTCDMTNNLWYIYKKVDTIDLSGYTLESQNGTKCLAVNNTTPLKYQALDCDTKLPALCNDYIQKQCKVTTDRTVWNGIEELCLSAINKRTFPVGPGDIGTCQQQVQSPLQGGMTTNEKQYWTGLIFFPRYTVSGEWLTFMGCWDLRSNGDMAIHLTNNGPSVCLNACPENTAVLALQGHVCECRSTLKGGFHAFIPECKVCSGGDNGQCEVANNSMWYIYKKVDKSDLSGYTLESQNGTKCLAVNNTTPLKYQVLDCDTTLSALCNKFIQRQCIPTTERTVWNGIEEVCSSAISKRTSPVGPGDIATCQQSGPLQGGSTTNGKQYWTGLTFISRYISGHQNPPSLTEPSSASQGANSSRMDYSADIQATPVSWMAEFSDDSLTPTLIMASKTAVHEELSSEINASIISMSLPAIQTSRGVYHMTSKPTVMSISIYIPSTSVTETFIQTSFVDRMTNSSMANSFASSTVTVIANMNSISEKVSIAKSTTHSAINPSTTVPQIHPTGSSSTTFSTTTATTAASTGADKQTVILIGASVGVVVAIILVAVGVGAYCMVKIRRGIKRVEETNIAKSEIVTLRILGSRATSIFTDSGTMEDFLDSQEMQEPDFTSLDRLPEIVQPSSLHNGLTSTGRESSDCYL